MYITGNFKFSRIVSFGARSTSLCVRFQVYGENSLVYGENSLVYGENNLVYGDYNLVCRENNLVYGENGIVYRENGIVYRENGANFCVRSVNLGGEECYKCVCLTLNACQLTGLMVCVRMNIIMYAT